MSKVNESRLLAEHNSCEYKCRLNKNACTSKQIWTHGNMDP